MELSLRGSQINLAVRDKPKVSSVKNSAHQRPYSANVPRHAHKSTLFRRPMSADEKLARSLKNCVKFSEHVMNEGQLWKSKKFISTSSTNLLKLLLEEPISRSYFQDSESLSDSSLGQRISKVASKQGQCKSIETSESDSNREVVQDVCNKSQRSQGDKANASSISRPNQSAMHESSHSTLNNGSSYNRKSSLPKPSNSLETGSDFWHNTKPDLPGRVSFGKVDDSAEADVKDFGSVCDIPSTAKKYVHFKDPEDRFNSNGSHNESSTSTCESNETYNIQNETHSRKCHCPFTPDSSGYTTLSETGPNVSYFEQPTQEQNLVIDEYKNELGDDEKKIQLELKMSGKMTNSNPLLSPETSTDRLISNYQTLANQIFEDIQADMMLSTDKPLDNTVKEQNDLSQPKSKSIDETEEISDLSIDSSKNQFENLRHFQESSSQVIRNYLRATDIKSAPSNHRKIKENNIDANKAENKSEKNRRIKSANTRSSSASKEKKGSTMKNTTTYSCLRQDSNLDEFQIEKVDSWMSLHDDAVVLRDSPEMYSDRRNQRAKTKSILKQKDNVAPTIKSSEDSSQDDSTYEEIVSVIKEIEEDKKKEIASCGEDIHLKLQPTSLSPESECLATPETKRDYSPDKYKDILNYLENVESSCDKTIMETRRSIPESSRSEIEFAIEPDIAEDVPKIADLLMLPNHQLARRIIALSLRANELANAIQLSKQHVAHIRLERQKALRQEKSNSSNRLKEQKKYYENIVTRHQGFIEQLLKDKGSLCEKVATLTRRTESQNQAWEHKLETELNRAKETAVAGEKIRREKWIRDNTKKIKELTVKGLEIEINRMNSEYQKQITELKRNHQQELLDVVAEERIKFEQLEKNIRETCTQDREESISKERDALRERFDKQLREEQQSFDEQRKKLQEEIAAEREKLYLEAKQKDLDMENKKQEMLKEKEIAVEQVYREFNEKFQKQEHKYQSRVSAIEKQFESDFLIWKREFENACKLREVDNENAIRQHYRSERDRQIDAIVAKMDAETQRCQEEYEMKVSRLKEKYETELHQMEVAEKHLKEKFHTTREKLAESEARVQNHQAEVKQLKMELIHSKKMCDKLLEEKEAMKDNARREVQQEIATIQAERDNEIEKIYQRVQQTIEKKDTAMELLQKENTTLRERCIKLEAIIRQQRKDYCIK